MILKWGRKKKRTAVVSTPSPGRYRMYSSTSPPWRGCGNANADNRWQRGLVGAATNVSSPPCRSRPMSSPPSPSRSPSIRYVSYDYPPSPSGNGSVAVDNRRLRLRPRRVVAESCLVVHSGSRSSTSVDDDGDEDYNPTLDDHRRRPHNGKKKKSHGGRGMELIKKLRRRIVDSNSNFGNRSIRNESHLPPKAVVVAACSRSRSRSCSGSGSHSDDAEYNIVILDVDPDKNRRRIVHSNSKKVVQDQESNRDGNG